MPRSRIRPARRRLDWRTLVLQTGVVMLGVVAGFQIDDWGQRRADRAKERVYLRQLAADLRETERRFTDLDRKMLAWERAPRRLIQAHYRTAPAHPDSVLRWALQVPLHDAEWPVTGTARALVSFGDLSLVRDDRLRAAITGYLDAVDENTEAYNLWNRLFTEHTHAYATLIDGGALLAQGQSPERLAALDAAEAWTAMVPADAVGALPPFDPAPFTRSNDMRRLLTSILIDKGNMKVSRDRFRNEAEALREQVETALADA